MVLDNPLVSRFYHIVISDHMISYLGMFMLVLNMIKVNRQKRRIFLNLVEIAKFVSQNLCCLLFSKLGKTPREQPVVGLVNMI
mgnify:CR=1 FL=1